MEAESHRNATQMWGKAESAGALHDVMLGRSDSLSHHWNWEGFCFLFFFSGNFNCSLKAPQELLKMRVLEFPGAQWAKDSV